MSDEKKKIRDLNIGDDTLTLRLTGQSRYRQARIVERCLRDDGTLYLCLDRLIHDAGIEDYALPGGYQWVTARMTGCVGTEVWLA